MDQRLHRSLRRYRCCHFGGVRSGVTGVTPLVPPSDRGRPASRCPCSACVRKGREMAIKIQRIRGLLGLLLTVLLAATALATIAGPAEAQLLGEKSSTFYFVQAH